MKKVLKTILAVIITYLVLCIILGTMMDEDTAFTYSMVSTLIITIVYNFIMIITKISKYNKNEKVSDVSDVVTILLTLFNIDKGLDVTLSTMMSTKTFTDKAKKSNKVLLYTNILLHIGIIFILSSLICYLIGIDSLESVSLIIGLFVLAGGILLPTIYGSKIQKKENYNNLEKVVEERQKLKSSTVLTYDESEYKKHVLPKNIIISVMLLIVFLAVGYNAIFNLYEGLINLIIFIPPVYWVYLLINRTKQRVMVIYLDPLEVVISPPGVTNTHNNYERREERIVFHKITSYKVTNSQIVIYGNIEKNIKKTFNSVENDKVKKLSVYKIPRVFNDSESLINILKQSIK